MNGWMGVTTDVTEVTDAGGLMDGWIDGYGEWATKGADAGGIDGWVTGN